MEQYPSYSVLIPAAGNSQRFKDIGIEQPKHELVFSWRGSERKPMLHHILDWLPAASEVHVGVQQIPLILKDEVHYWQMPKTEGQSHTIQCLTQYVEDPSLPVLVLNCDAGFSYPLRTFVGQCLGSGLLAGALVTDGHGNTGYSYVDCFPHFMMAAEKQVLSDFAMTGAYFFRDIYTLQHLIARQMAERFTHHREYFLSGAFGMRVGPSLGVYTPRQRWHVWGTPEELVRSPDVDDFDEDVAAKLERIL